MNNLDVLKKGQQQLSKERQRTQQESSINQWLRAFQADFYKVDRQNKTRQLLREPNSPFGNQGKASARAIQQDGELFSKEINVLPDQEFNGLKVAPIQEAAGTNNFVADTFLGTGHYMYTNGTVDPNGLIRAHMIVKKRDRKYLLDDSYAFHFQLWKRS
jgi:hypothetical protein